MAYVLLSFIYSLVSFYLFSFCFLSFLRYTCIMFSWFGAFLVQFLFLFCFVSLLVFFLLFFEKELQVDG